MDTAHRVEEGGHDSGGQPERQLVDAQQLGFDEERHGQGEHLLLASRQVSSELTGSFVEDGKKGRGAFPGFLCRSPVPAQGPRSHPEVLRDGQRGEDAAAAGHHRQALIGNGLGGVGGDVTPGEGDAAFAGGEQTGHRPEEAGFAGSVGAQQRHDLALADGQVDPKEDLHLPVGGVDPRAAQQHAVIGAVHVGGGRNDHDRRAHRGCLVVAGIIVGVGPHAGVDPSPAGQGNQEPVPRPFVQTSEPRGEHHQYHQQADAGQHDLQVGELDAEPLDECHTRERARDRRQPSDDDHGEHGDAVDGLKGLVTDTVEDHHVQGPCHPGDRPGDHERHQPGPGRRHRGRLGGAQVIPGGQDDPTRPGLADTSGEHGRHDEHPETQQVQVSLPVEVEPLPQDRAHDRGGQLLAEVGRVEEEVVGRDREGQRGDGQVHAAHPQGRKTQHQRDGRARDARRH